jgi:ribosome-binding factor A
VIMMDEAQSLPQIPSPPLFRRFSPGESQAEANDSLDGPLDGTLDGLDPRHEKRSRLAGSRRAKPDYAALRLAGEIASSLNLLLASSSDSNLSGFAVASATPTGKGSHFLVRIYATDSTFAFDPERVMASLKRAKPFFRQEIASAITRKHAPDFRFQLLPPGAQPF